MVQQRGSKMHDQFRAALKQWLEGDNKNIQELAVHQFGLYLRQFPDTLSLLNRAEINVAVVHHSDRDSIACLLIDYREFPPELIYSYNSHLLDRLCYAWYLLTDIDRVVVMGVDAYTGQKVLVQAETEIRADGLPRVQLYSYAGGNKYDYRT
ncbi:MAG: hypothetical protein SFW36_01305 [Leptolyngbyaceae cyanobacterium bins.59]|nr:hypothetical protein [Leptolyngbyaceae cyanobacterium bins.59]